MLNSSSFHMHESVPSTIQYKTLQRQHIRIIVINRTKAKEMEI